jgi:RNA polymerase sigma-70 factor (ECF subfamily)
VHRTLARLLPAHEHEDAFQETWRRAIERLAAFRGASRLRTWLLGIALNCAREERRARGGGLRLVPLDPDEHAHEPAGEAHTFEHASRAELEQAIAGLAPGYRAVLLLHDVEGRTHAEIGAVLDIEAGTSKSQLARARRALRRALARAHEQARGTQ